MSHSSFNGFGTTYKLHLANVKWTETILHSFTGEGTPDGENPAGGLAFDKAGNLWGATAFGGAGNSSTCGDPDGGVGMCGSVYELTPNADGTWTESTLYSFADASTGWNPFSGVILDQAGDLVGTTENGGSALQGTVFAVTPGAGGQVTERLIHELDGDDFVYLPGADGALPADDRLALGPNGEIFGAAGAAGDLDRKKTGCSAFSNVPGGCGVVFAVQQ